MKWHSDARFVLDFEHSHNKSRNWGFTYTVWRDEPSIPWYARNAVGNNHLSTLTTSGYLIGNHAKCVVFIIHNQMGAAGNTIDVY